MSDRIKTLNGIGECSSLLVLIETRQNATYLLWENKECGKRILKILLLKYVIAKCVNSCPGNEASGVEEKS